MDHMDLSNDTVFAMPVLTGRKLPTLPSAPMTDAACRASIHAMAREIATLTGGAVGKIVTHTIPTGKVGAHGIPESAYTVSPRIAGIATLEAHDTTERGCSHPMAPVALVRALHRVVAECLASKRAHAAAHKALAMSMGEMPMAVGA